MTNFETAYSSLNSAQKLAVDTIEGPVLVLAGPGTGKTQVLTTRIANILKNTDTDPGSILALTFTDAATKEMRQRLIKLIGKDGYLVHVTTFHSFCNQVILDNPDRFSRPVGMQNVSDLEKIQVIKDILEKGHYENLKPINDPLYYTPYIIGSLSILKREGINLHKFTELVSIFQDELNIQKDELSKTALLEKQKQVGKNLDLLDIYEKYQNKLVELGRFDYDDSINWVVESFETDPDLLLNYQEKYQYFLVDEYQDTNSAQNRLIFTLASFWGDKANLFAVGDPNQSIYRFQGASKENVEQFKRAFPNHIRVILDQNYRSTDNVLKLAAGLIHDDPLVANTNLPNQKLQIAKFSSSVFEDEYLIHALIKKIKAGAKPQDIAIIAKENKDLENLVPLFKKHQLPFRLESGTDILHTPYLRQFIKILTITSSLQTQVDDLELFTVLNYSYFQLSPLLLLQLAHTAHTAHQSLFDILIEKKSEVIEKFISWNSQSFQKTLPETFQTIFQESGLLNHLLSLPESVIELNRFNTLFEDAKTQSSHFPDLTLQKYLQNLQTMATNNLKLVEKDIIGREEAITLTTAHKSKGLEWQTVFIYRFADTHWGNKMRREMIKLPPGIIVFENVDEEEDKNSEERRLFYVALTRAKQELILTGASEYENSTRMTFPSIFIEDLPSHLIESLDVKQLETNTQELLINKLTPTPAITENPESEYLQNIIKDFKLSSTALNTYLYCPYKFKLDNLYRLPRTKAPAMCFGTAVHFTLEQLSRKSLSLTQFLFEFENALRKEILSLSDFQDRLRHGQKILSAYYNYYQKEAKKILFTEKNFGTSFPVHLYDIPLIGKVDRIDLVNKTKKTTKFIDYKTGKPKTRNEIEGNTKNSDGDYKRQLVFYQLLSELDKTFGYKVVETEIDFVEPNEKGDFKKEKFSISLTEVDDLKNVIRETMASIRALDFSRTPDTAKCSTCPFLSHCFPNQ